MDLRLLGRDQALAQQQLDVAVIAGPGEEGSLPEVVQTAVADVRPPGGLLLHHAHRAGCPRTMLDRQLGAELDDLLVRAPESQVQKSHRVEERLRCLREGLEDDLLRHFGGTGAIGVTAHAVHDDEQRAVLGNRGRDPVLVLLASAQETDIGVVHSQEEIRASVRLGRAFISPAAASFRSHVTTITSMTGFARREASGPWGTLVCELRSVNHRFLEASFRLPDELRATEPDLRQRLAREVKRGKVDCSMSARRVLAASATLEVDAQAIERLVMRIREIARVLPEHTVNVLDVLRWPGVLREDSGQGDEVLLAARALFDGTLEDLVAARAREGVRLRELLDQRCTSLEGLVSHVRARLPEVHARVRARLNERLAELQANVDHDRLEQELALLLQRLDVDEELDRLSGHIVEIRRIIRGSEPAGRRLDFLIQELNREANTLSSKSQDLETTRSAVDMKVLIEQMREQVQNVE